MSNSNETIYNLVTTIVEEFNTQQLDTPDRRINQASGETNIYYNKDVRYFLGGIVNQIAWSITSKTKYIDETEDKIARERENNPTNPDTINLDKALHQAEASKENALFFYDLFVQLHDVLADIPWNDGKMTNKQGKKDYGQEWYALYRSSLQGEISTKKYDPKAKEQQLKDSLKAKLISMGKAKTK